MKSLSSLYVNNLQARGVFIAVEGPDGSGKTTLAHRLSDFFGAHDTFEPTDTGIGRLLRSSLSGDAGLLSSKAEALLFAADRQEHIEKMIKPTLLKGENVVTDRYVLSSLVYQGAKLGVNWVYEINKFSIIPDVTIVLKAAPSIMWERINTRNKLLSRSLDHYETYEQIRANADRYDDLVRDILPMLWGSEPFVLPLSVSDYDEETVFDTVIMALSGHKSPVRDIVRNMQQVLSLG